MIYTVEESLQNFKALIIFPDKSKQVSKKRITIELMNVISLKEY